MINIVMIVRNRPRLAQQAIDSLIANTDAPASLTIVDDQSRDETRGLLASYAGQGSFQIALVRNEVSKGTGWARNLGVWVAEKYWSRGDWLYFSDSDAYFTVGWAGKLLEVFDGLNHDDSPHRFPLLGGYNHPYHFPIGYEHGLFQPGIPTEWGRVQEYYALGHLSCLMRWETWDKHGPLDANALGVCQSEDSALSERVRKDGGRVGVLIPHVVYNCGLTNSFGQPTVGHEAMIRHTGMVME